MFAFLLSLIALLSQATAAQPGSLDQDYKTPIFDIFLFGSIYDQLLWPQTNGKLYLTAAPESPGGLAKLMRLESNGSLDSTFSLEMPNGFAPVVVAFEGDGQILTMAEGSTEARVMRFSASGALDPTFQANLPLPFSAVFLIPTMDGKVWVGGAFSTVNGVECGGLARLNSNGSVDPAFQLKTNALWLNSLALQGDKLLVTATFKKSFDTVERKFLRVFSDGSIDTGFNGEMGGFHTFVDSQGRILVTGYRYELPGRRIIFWRLLRDGNFDPSFQEITSDGEIYSAGFQRDGKIVVSGYFENLNEIPRQKVARLHNDGSVDLTFDAGRWVTNHRTQMRNAAIQPDGKILLCGTVFSDMTVTRGEGFLMRLHGDEQVTFLQTVRDGGFVKMDIANTTGLSWELQKSSDFISWHRVATIQPAATGIRFEAGSAGREFYRGVLGN